MVRSFLLAALTIVLVLFSGNWEGPDRLLAESKGLDESFFWEDITSSNYSIPAESTLLQFNNFLQENIEGKLSLSTLEWLSLPAREYPYQSWYLGILNGYHVFSLQVQGDYDFNLYVFDQDGGLRDRREIIWGNDGGSVDLLDQKIVQINRYLAEDAHTGIEEINLQIDLNGQFMELRGPEYIHPGRDFPQASATILSHKFLAEYNTEELLHFRNELLASSGFVFKNKETQLKFEDKEWYIPGTNSIDLSNLEEYNLLLLEQAIALK